jgi:hypothetical protein
LLEAFKNYWFYCAKLIEASSRLARGFQKLLVLPCKTHRGFIEACSRLSKTFSFAMQNSSRLHRGIVEASSKQVSVVV